MISVCMLGGGAGSSAAVAGYYLAPDQACGMAYYSEHDRIPGRWVGAGAEALALSGRLGPQGAARLVQLLNAQGPDGQSLGRPVWRPDPGGRLPGGPLLAALEQLACGQGVPLDRLLPDPCDRATLLGLVRRSNASAVPALPPPPASPVSTVDSLAGEPAIGNGPVGGGSRRGGSGGFQVDAAVVEHLAVATGLQPIEVFRGPDGTDRFTPARAKAGGRVDVRRVGIDITVSAPKSVSVLQALADPQTAAVIALCHDRAVKQALGYLQRQAGHGLRGHHGDGQAMDRVPTDGLIAAAFTHHTSRAGDPQLHTHLVVPNLLRGKDGKWSAVDSRAVFRHAKTAGFLYQAALRHELARELEVVWTVPVKGQAEIVGVPREVLREFSQRRRQIETALARTSGKGRRAAQAACLATRQRKQHTPLEVLRASWQQRTAQLGTSTATLLHATGVTAAAGSDDEWHTPFARMLRTRRAHQAKDLTLTPQQLTDVAALVLGPEGVTAKTTGFDRRDLLQALAITVPVHATGNATDLERLADQLLTQPTAVPVTPSGEDEPRWTTLELLATEHHALTLAAKPTRPLAAAERVGQLLQRQPWLSKDQQEAITHLNNDPRLATVLVGPAGSGKTAVLTAIKDLAAGEGHPVIGCSLAALTARRLQQGSGVPSSSLAQLLAHLDNPATPLEPGTIVIVDEAGMVGTRQLARLLEHTDRAHGRVLLVGDPEQLPEIDAGGMFRHLSEAEQQPAVLLGNQRQQHPWEIAALERLRNGHHAAALASYVQHGRVSTADSREQLHALVVQDYLTATAGATSPAEVRETVVLASQHLDVDALNHQIRQGLQQQDRLEPDTLTLELPTGPVGFTAGDQVILTRPSRDLAGRKILNGTRGQLTDASPAGIRVQPQDGPAFILDPPSASQALRHGYALTVHKAQGVTVTTALVLSDGLTRNAAYTALSRGRQRNQLYLHTDDPQTGQPNWPAAFTRLCHQLSRHNSDDLASRQVLHPARRPATTRPYQEHSPHTPPPSHSLGI